MTVEKLKAYLAALEKQALQLSGAILAVTQVIQLAEQETAQVAAAEAAQVAATEVKD